LEEQFQFKQGNKMSSLRGRVPNKFRIVSKVFYKSSPRRWVGFGGGGDNFAARWSGFVFAPYKGKYGFKLRSDDGSKLWINGRYTVNNDGTHGMRSRTARRQLVGGQHSIRLEYFDKGGSNGMEFEWKLPKGKKYVAVPRKHFQYLPKKGLKEEIYYKQNNRKKVPNLNIVASNQRIVSKVLYPNGKRVWRGFAAKENFACRWSGKLVFRRAGTYRFSLTSDDGSRMFLGSSYRRKMKKIVDNDGLHGFKQKEGMFRTGTASKLVLLEFFQGKGGLGMSFKYMGPDTKNKMVPVRGNAHVYYGQVKLVR
jgi:hypothetical protein